MFGLFAFFYVLLHFSVYLLLDQAGKVGALWQDIVKRPYITIGMLGLLLLDSPRRHLHREGAAAPGPALDAIAPPGLRGRAARRMALLVGGQEGHPRAAPLCLRARVAARLSALEAAQNAARRFSVARFARTDGA